MADKKTAAVLALALASGVVDAATTDGERRLPSAERSVVATGAAWPVITLLNDGSLGLVIQRAKPLEAIDAASVSIEWARSVDGGDTWSKAVPLSEPRPYRPSFSQHRDGSRVVYQYRNEALGQLPSGRIVCAFCELDYYYNKDGTPRTREKQVSPWANKALLYTWSDDLGKTWSPPRRVRAGPFVGIGGGACPHGRIITLKDGTAMMSLYGMAGAQGKVGFEYGVKSAAAVIRSRDNAEHWGDVSLIVANTDSLSWEETSLCLVNERLLAHVRTSVHSIMQYASDDGGRSWKGPMQVTEAGQHPGGAVLLRSGRVILIWGNRRPPFGVAASLSEDGGRTWDYERRVSLVWDAINANSGYANGIQRSDGTIVVVYYAMADTSGSYRALWKGSIVYAVRFSEDALVVAAQQRVPAV